MKNKFLNIFLLIIPVLGAIGVLIFSGNTHFKSFAVIVLLGAFAGISTRVYFSYLIPSQRLFKIRFLFHGIAFGIFLTLLLLIIEMGNNSVIKWNYIAVMLIMGQIFGILSQYISSLIDFNILYKKTKLNRIAGEVVLLSDRAFYSDNQKYISGRLILTNQRLCFRSKKMDYSQNDLIFSESMPEFEEVKLLGMPAGFSIKENNMKIRVNYPLFWKREIMTQIQLSIT